MLFNYDNLSGNGFAGYQSIGELKNNSTGIPKVRGLYMVLYRGIDPPTFTLNGTGGFFKGRNPNVSIDILKSNWVDGANVIYIGKAGGDGSSATLQSRLRQYLRFGQGKAVGHWGGRLIWQLKEPLRLEICWKELPKSDPESVESSLIGEFINQYGKRPFANLRG